VTFINNFGELFGIQICFELACSCCNGNFLHLEWERIRFWYWLAIFAILGAIKIIAINNKNRSRQIAERRFMKYILQLQRRVHNQVQIWNNTINYYPKMKGSICARLVDLHKRALVICVTQLLSRSKRFLRLANWVLSGKCFHFPNTTKWEWVPVTQNTFIEQYYWSCHAANWRMLRTHKCLVHCYPAAKH